MPEILDVELHIVLNSTTPSVRGGVQIGSGSAGFVRDWQRMTGAEARFVAHAQVRDGQLPLRGEAIQKDGKGRFIYIVWRDDTGVVSRRAKIYVETIDQAMLDSAMINRFPLSPASDEGAFAGERGQGGKGELAIKVRFETLLPGKAKDDLPCCATVKPIRDWRAT